MVSYDATTASAALPTISQRWSGDRLAARTSGTDRRWEYRYTARGEVKEAWQQTGSAVTTPAAGETLAGTGISYAYDGIGNRLTHTEGGRGSSTASTDPNGVASSTVTLQDQRIHDYTPNAANQYTQITHPAFFNVKGTRTAGATIAVNGVAIATPTATATSGYQPGGTGTIFRAEVPNTAPAGFTGGTVDLYQPVTITQNGTQLTVDDPVQYVPPPTETLNYDADGNLKTDGRWTYAWDAADRLIKMESIAFVQNAVTTPPLLPAVNVSAKVIEFAYDGLSRRIRKKVTEGVSTIAVWEAYVYDGWNMVLSVKLNPAAGATQGRPQSAIASNVWAPDLGSQPFARRDWQKAGGVRGLVLANYFTGANGGGIHVPGMDPMGNVTSVTRLGMSYSAGESPGPYFRSEFVYDYDAFGKETRSSTLVAGLNPDSFPFHFSTKFTDPESGFNYYGYRFYDPANGRWLNRDPIGEKGGMNLYRTVRNNLIRYVDRLGLDIVEFRRPANIPIVGRLADHSTVEVDIDSPDPSNPGKPTSTSVDTNSNGTTVTDLNAKPSQNPKNKLQESERIPATNEEGKAVTEAARGPKSPLPTKGSYQWPADDCGETIDHLKNILNDYRNMPRNDFRDKYGLPQDPSHPPKTPPLPPPLDGIGTFDGVVQGP